MITPLEQFTARIRRLEQERLYSRRDWKVPVRTVRIPRDDASPRKPLRLRLSLKEWLLHPLFIARPGHPFATGALADANAVVASDAGTARTVPEELSGRV